MKRRLALVSLALAWFIIGAQMGAGFTLIFLAAKFAQSEAKVERLVVQSFDI